MENHDNYSIEELVLNPSFHAYVLGTNSNDKELWETYFMQHPQQTDKGKKASNIINLLAKAKKKQSLTKEQDYLRLLDSIDRRNRFHEAFQSFLPSSFSNIAKFAAAIILLICISGIGGFFLSNHSLMKEPIGISKTVVGKGQKSMVFLPDGTEIWLNSESTLTYSTNFGRTTRDVNLIGEAYFKVHKDKRHQFVVHISDVEVKVYGTEFNIKSYSDENTVETTLVTGSLSVQKISGKQKSTPLFLKSKQTAVIYKTENVLTKEDIDTKTSNENKVIKQPSVYSVNTIKPEKVFLYTETNLDRQIAWKYNKLIFKDETFKELAQKFERWYDIKIVFESVEIQEYRYRGIFENETIEQALNAMRYTTPFDYKMDHRTIYITAKNEKKKGIK